MAGSTSTPKGWVADCSFTSALFLPAEQSVKVEKFVEGLMRKKQVLLVPHLWTYETGNVLNVALKRERIKPSDLQVILGLLGVLPLDHMPPPHISVISDILSCAREYELSFYDASYLSLALNLGLGLATLDISLRGAAMSSGVPIFV